MPEEAARGVDTQLRVDHGEGVHDVRVAGRQHAEAYQIEEARVDHAALVHVGRTSVTDWPPCRPAAPRRWAGPVLAMR